MDGGHSFPFSQESILRVERCSTMLGADVMALQQSRSEIQKPLAVPPARGFSGRVAKLAIGRVEPIITQLSRFVNLLKSEEAPEQIVLIVDGPLAGKSEAFAQPQHRFEPSDRPARRFE